MMHSRYTIGNNMSTTSTPEFADDIPLYIKITLPSVVVILATIITCLIFRRHPGICRRCKKKKEVQRDFERQTMLPSANQHLRPTPREMRMAPQPNSTFNNTSTTGDGQGQSSHSDHRLLQDYNGFSPTRPHLTRSIPKHVYCDHIMENTVYAHTSDLPVEHSPCKTEESSDVFHDISRAPHNAKLRQKGDSDICEPFIPGGKGYVTTSSPSVPALNRCRRRDGYITARPEYRSSKPVNVCHPITRSEENIPDCDYTGKSITDFDGSSQKHGAGTDDPVYERLDRYYRPRVVSCPSSRVLRQWPPLSSRRSQYDSLPLLPQELSVVEIPIGPFISSEKREDRMAETVENITKRASFENMFEGAWWHGESEPDLVEASADVPDRPRTQLRNKISTLPCNLRHSTHKSISAPYVTMNRGTRYGAPAEHGDACASAHPGHLLSVRTPANSTSYMSHGQMMKMLQVYVAEDFTDDRTRTQPAPKPCAVHHDYVNARSISDKQSAYLDLTQA